MKYKVLIIEDEANLLQNIKHYFDKHTFDITSISFNNVSIHKYINSCIYDVIILKLGNNDKSIEVSQNIRTTCIYSIIVFLADTPTYTEREDAYLAGVDAYISEPFHKKLLVLKIESMIKRRNEIKNFTLPSNNNLQHDEKSKRFFYASHKLSLTRSEYEILKILFVSPNTIHTKDSLSQKLYDNNIGTIDRKGIATHIYNIRKKIKSTFQDTIIYTKHGEGYSLNKI